MRSFFLGGRVQRPPGWVLDCKTWRRAAWERGSRRSWARALGPRVDRSADRPASKAGPARRKPAGGVKRATGIEPVLRAWKALVQPLHHARQLHWKAESSGRSEAAEHGRVQRVSEIDPVAIMRELGVDGPHSASVLAANRGKGVWRIQGDSGAFALRVLRPDEHETALWNNAPWTRPGCRGSGSGS